MIIEISLCHNQLTKNLYEMQKASYLVEAKLVNFYELPPLIETFEQLVNCGESFLGYFEDEEVVGAISYTIENEELSICRMTVHPDHFRKGIAGKLLVSLEEKALFSKLIKVSTGKDNEPAKKLYLKNGFNWSKDIEVAPGFYISLFEKML